MGVWILVAIVIFILSMIKMPAKSTPKDGETSEYRRRQLRRRAARRKTRGLPWMDPGTLRKRY